MTRLSSKKCQLRSTNFSKQSEKTLSHARFHDRQPRARIQPMRLQAVMEAAKNPTLLRLRSSRSIRCWSLIIKARIEYSIKIHNLTYF